MYVQVMPDGSIERPPYAYTNPLAGDAGCLIQGTARPWSEGLRSDEPVCPDFGYMCFNTFLQAIFTNFKCVTMEGWAQAMWYAQDIGHPTVGWVYFVVMLTFVSFNIMNLYVASMSNAYVTVKQNTEDALRIARIEAELKERAKKDRAERRARRERRAAGLEHMADGDEVEGAGAAAAAEEEGGEESSEEEEEEEGGAEMGGYDEDGNRLPPRRSLSEVLFDPNTYWMKHEDHTQPINGLARALRTLTCYPQQVDECGTLVSPIYVCVCVCMYVCMYV